VADDAELGVVDASIGLSPTSGLTWLLPRIVGLGNALYLVLASPRLDADRAQALGFAQEVVPHDRLRARALELAATMATHPVLGMRLSKRALTRAAVSTLAEATRREHADELRCFEDEAVLRAFAQFGAPEIVTRQPRTKVHPSPRHED
jgi:enoyl-CoA hydratase/carnithine racemase